MQGAGAAPLRRAVKWSFILALVAFIYAALLPPALEIAGALLYRQDRWLLLAQASVLAGAVLIARRRMRRLEGQAPLYLAGFALMAPVCLLGHRWLLSAYDLSRDEQMADFDAAVLAGGRLSQPLPPMWRDCADALNTLFMYPAEHRAGWISSYLPLNAGIRAMLGLLGDPAWAGPLMTAVGGLALWGCARRLWPADREMAALCALLYLGSGQVLFAGMTSYAMSAHLALNMVWLWLYLKGRWPADSAATAVGFVAMGLHQPIMHPMFAAPLLYLLVRRKEWQRAAFFAFFYGLAGLFWLWWPNWIWHLVQAGPATARPAGVDFLSRLLMVLSQGNYGKALPDMAVNLLRFFAWQHVLLLPLLMLGFAATRHDALARAIAGGLWFTLIIMTIILPDQGHGFGYRYFHGLIGNAVLVAAFGWKQLKDATPIWRGLLLVTTALACVVILPMQSWMAYRQYRPYAELDQRLLSSPAAYVLIGAVDAPYAKDLVYNPPRLDRGPIRLLRDAVGPEMALRLCVGGKQAALVHPGDYRAIAAFFNSAVNSQAERENGQAAGMLARAGCRVTYL
ncbi:resistance to Congo red protein [Novosphingobium sp. KACC 22771]|uniref:resistance to Congo red protein n=1 Tax=Novosphingobium sp. KACC 22771 TaxID=3025670 RepID=UPI002366E679|nr:resistance to Congo red protein [Novosphingobium sp. KACC 22771]WDF75099.1 resistance to Congo red protein [Novosphingobium sp. KACC 22771]